MFILLVQRSYSRVREWRDVFWLNVFSWGIILLLMRLSGFIWGKDAIGAYVSDVPLFIFSTLGFILISVIIASLRVAAVRIIFTRLSGRKMSISKSLRIGNYLKPVVTYSIVSVLISVTISVISVLLMYGPNGMIHYDYSIGGLPPEMNRFLSQDFSKIGHSIVVIYLPLAWFWLLCNTLVIPVIVAEKRGGLDVVVRSGKLVMSTFGVVFAQSLAMLFIYIGHFVFLFGVLATGNMSNSVIRLGAFEHVVNAIGFMINAAFFSIVQVFNALWYVESRKATR